MPRSRCLLWESDGWIRAYVLALLETLLFLATSKSKDLRSFSGEASVYTLVQHGNMACHLNI